MTTMSFVRRVKNIRRNRTAQEAIDATGSAKCVDPDVLATMPVGQGPEEVELVYFRLGRYVYPDELDAEYKASSLEPDPQAQAADNEADPAFAEEHPNATQWDRQGRVASYLAFGRWSGERPVLCRNDDDWDGGWWFAGVRKSSPPQAEK